jgi:hypothetical protein
MANWRITVTTTAWTSVREDGKTSSPFLALKLLEVAVRGPIKCFFAWLIWGTTGSNPRPLPRQSIMNATSNGGFGPVQIPMKYTPPKMPRVLVIAGSDAAWTGVKTSRGAAECTTSLGRSP